MNSRTSNKLGNNGSSNDGLSTCGLNSPVELGFSFRSRFILAQRLGTRIGWRLPDWGLKHRGGGGCGLVLLLQRGSTAKRKRGTPRGARSCGGGRGRAQRILNRGNGNDFHQSHLFNSSFSKASAKQ
jgi:hypothetical protein